MTEQFTYDKSSAKSVDSNEDASQNLLEEIYSSAKNILDESGNSKDKAGSGNLSELGKSGEFLQGRLDSYFKKHENWVGLNDSLKSNGITEILRGLASGNPSVIDKAVKSMKDPASNVGRMAEALNEILEGTRISVRAISDEVTKKAGGLVFEQNHGAIGTAFVSINKAPESHWYMHPAPPVNFGASWVASSMLTDIKFSAVRNEKR